MEVQPFKYNLNNLESERNLCSEPICLADDDAQTDIGYLNLWLSDSDWLADGLDIYKKNISAYINNHFYNLKPESGENTASLRNPIDLMGLANIEKIRKIALFDENWDGVGGHAFSAEAIDFFKMVIWQLCKQPQIAPTGRNSLFMQYELDNKSVLAFELSTDRVEKVYVPYGDYSRAKSEMITENIVPVINEYVKEFYGI